MKKTLILSFFLIITEICFAQVDSVSSNEFYIPKNIKECIQQLDIVFTKKAKDQFKQLDEDGLKRIYGTLITNEWFENDSTRLNKYFYQLGIDDFQKINYLILKSYHSKLNNTAFDFYKECELYKNEMDSLNLEKENQYKIDIVADSIDGVYIPADIHDCFTELNRLLNDSTKLMIKEKNTAFDLSEYHMGIGRWMRNNWRLWGGSRLQTYFINKNVKHPDNISGIILFAYSNYLKGENIDIDKIIEKSRLEEEDFIKNHPPLKSTVEFKVPKPSKKYRRFLRTRRIDNFEDQEY